MVAEAVNSCPFDVKRVVFGNIIVCGGLASQPNIDQLIDLNLNETANAKKIRESLAYKKDELAAVYAPKKLDVNVKIHSSASNATFFGCSMICEEPFFEKKFISKVLFEEMGESIVRRHFYAFK